MFQFKYDFVPCQTECLDCGEDHGNVLDAKKDASS